MRGPRLGPALAESNIETIGGAVATRDARHLPIVRQSGIARGSRCLKVGFVVVPFATTFGPSIQAGLLQSLATNAGHECDSIYVNLDFAVEIGISYYEQLAHLPLPLLGEWLFSGAAFLTDTDPSDAFLTEIDITAIEERVGLGPSELRRIRRFVVPEFVRRVVAEGTFDRYEVLAFSSVFQQTCAAIALARAVRARNPRIVTIFGGPNFQGSMGAEFVRNCDVIDFVSINDGDEGFPAFLNAIASGGNVAGIVNIADRINVESSLRNQRTTHDLDKLPTPDYSQYFDRAEKLGLDTSEVEVPLETSRGCWWGAKHHCSFCGLDPKTSMRFRSKSSPRIEEEMFELSARHGAFRFFTTDNIANMEHFRALFPNLAARSQGLSVFFEVKANLTREQLRILRGAGVDRIQPGIESLSSRVLRLIDKGVTAIQNINTLRWATYYGFDIQWNLIWGFPGETGDDYRRIIDATYTLHHLQPPVNSGRVELFRYSPMFLEPGRFPTVFRRPNHGYQRIFPPEIRPEEIAYFFEYAFDASLPEGSYDELARALSDWRERWKQEPRPSLEFRCTPGIAQISDARLLGKVRSYTLTGTLANVYAMCAEKPQHLGAILERQGRALSEQAVAAALGELVASGLMFTEDDRYLSLALPAGAAT